MRASSCTSATCWSWSLGGDELGACPLHLLWSAAIIPVWVSLAIEPPTGSAARQPATHHGPRSAPRRRVGARPRHREDADHVRPALDLLIWNGAVKGELPVSGAPGVPGVIWDGRAGRRMATRATFVPSHPTRLAERARPRGQAAPACRGPLTLGTLVPQPPPRRTR